MGLLTTLKTQTATAHAALEAQLDITRHFQTLDGYRSLLERFFTLYEPLEACLGLAVDWQEQGWDFESRRKTAWLRQDLAALGLTPADIQGLLRCSPLPAIQDLGAAIGCLYVLEGSTLGGQVITKLLQEKLPVTPETGGQFFAGYQDQNVPRWREFGTWVEGCYAADPALETTAVVAACETFDCFARWFTF